MKRPDVSATASPASLKSSKSAKKRTKPQGRATPSASEGQSDTERRSSWLAGFQFSTFTLVMAGVLIIGVVSLIPRIQEVVSQRNQIASLENEIQVTQQQIEDMKAERLQWNDTTFITSQARERLFFVMPGEVSYLVINDLSASDLASERATISDEVQLTRSDWMENVLGSVWSAGLAHTVTSQPVEGAQ